jgi:competence protein ComEA
VGLDKKISDQGTGFLLLLLVVLLLFSSRFLELPSGHDEAPCPDPLFVQVDGDVRNPGVYSFCSVPTVQNLVEKAGGLKEKRAFLHLPPEWSLSSGARVVFTSQGKDCDLTQTQMSPFHKLTLGIPLSLNRESEEGFAALPGIGPSLAKAIVEERTRRGGFRDPEEIKEITGIGPKLYARIRPHLRV